MSYKRHAKLQAASRTGCGPRYGTAQPKDRMAAHGAYRTPEGERDAQRLAEFALRVKERVRGGEGMPTARELLGIFRATGRSSVMDGPLTSAERHMAVALGTVVVLETLAEMRRERRTG